MNWTPDALQIEWGRQMISCMADNGRWGVPATEQIYVFKKSINEIWLVAGLNTPMAVDCFEKIKIVFEQLGYTVLDKRITEPRS